ncbi:AzlC family ABC transporter permease [Acetivibrio sp. MSJd-27]|uniref:AzlC family ABC transporter permease n=1 Tax=Acetivibrio sp. MSJd-27 TaxID=2841523 RepID=UPI001C0F8D0E|nr:AzlC family ABC transporter permease [Acetivibrio sp. MSJd-27]MBU5449590.1 AzlC family ABC transporter permease [Acetivibrio sp. MSJd-27]
MHAKQKAFRAAFPLTLPILAGFLFLGCSYGVLMVSKGFSIWYPIFMATFIFAGSMEFVTVHLLLSAFQPLSAFFLALMVNARHLFYGISMLETYRGTGRKKWYLIFGMCDESFSINFSAKISEDVDKGWFYFFVTLLNQIYWVGGTALGAVLGSFITISTKGIEFVMTALFTVIFLDQWMETKRHIPSAIGILFSVLCLALFGAEHFMLPAMAAIVLFFALFRNKLPVGSEQEVQS